MKKTPTLLILAAALMYTGLQADETDERMRAMEAQIRALRAELSALKADANNTEAKAADPLDALKAQVGRLNRNTSGSHLKFDVDLRTAVDNLRYEMADGSDRSNDALLTNRLWLGMRWRATDTLSFTGQLAYNKAFGQRSGFGGGTPGFETFDWIANENAYDDRLRVRSAYFFYRSDTFLGTDIPWTFSLGRRPSANGHLINLREDDPAASPMAHTINVEFDGLSSRFGFETLTGIPGMYLKFCAGRGGTDADARFFTIDANGTVGGTAPYAANGEDIPDIDLAGFIFVPYDDGQYRIATQYFYAAHLIDANPEIAAGGSFTGMQDVGNLHAFTANVVIDGIGDGWNDFLDGTLFFISGAWSMTDPKRTGQGMLGSNGRKTGSSYWIGLQMPTLFTKRGRFGAEFNHGSRYWRPVTYAEDTNIGSKVAARGNAYEAYYTDDLIGEILSFQIRYTYIDYVYSGSNGFFGSATGTPVKIDAMASSADPYVAAAAPFTVERAQDIRVYLRYRY